MWEQDNFFDIADQATRKKIDFVMKYFGIYFNIVLNQLKKSAGYNSSITIKYIDPFSGPGKYKDGLESVPIRFLKYMKDLSLENIKFVFNDLYHSDELRQNLEEIKNEIPDFSKITILGDDANNIDFHDYFNSSDIVISYVDPYSYTRVDPETIRSLTENKFSDSLFFLNLNYFHRHIDFDKDNLVNFFGSNQSYETVRDSIINDPREKSTENLINEYVRILTNNSGRYILPIFFRKSHKETLIFNAIFLVSKCKLGLDRIKECIDGTDHFFFEDGRFIVYESSYNQIEEYNLFDSKEDYVFDHISCKQFMSVQELIDKIDKAFIEKFGYISAYNSKNIKDILNTLENENKLEISYAGIKKRSKRLGKNTYGDNTKFKKQGVN